MEKHKLEKFFIQKDKTIRCAMEMIDQNTKGIVYVVDKDNKLLGTVTDGDIRRHILQSKSIDDKVDVVYNNNPRFITTRNKQQLIKLFSTLKVKSVPVLDKHHKITDIIFYDEIMQDDIPDTTEKIDVPVVIMAGGKGTRLKPYTDIIPKPLIPIGDKTIVERIIDKFYDAGMTDFYMAINYKKNMIKGYFNEVDKPYNLTFIEEDIPLGTGGSLRLLDGSLNGTFFVTNCDILVECDLADVYNFHKQNNNKITLVTALKKYQIPYGVIKLNEEGNLDLIDEKPTSDYLVNTGIYVLESSVLKDVPLNEFFHITDLINIYTSRNEKIGVYPVSEQSYLDMGEHQEMEKMLKKLSSL